MYLILLLRKRSLLKPIMFLCLFVLQVRVEKRGSFPKVKGYVYIIIDSTDFSCKFTLVIKNLVSLDLICATNSTSQWSSGSLRAKVNVMLLSFMVLYSLFTDDGV